MKSVLKSLRVPSLRLRGCLLILILPTLTFAQFRRTRIAVLDFGASATASTVGDAFRSTFSSNPNSLPTEFEVLDRELTKSAVRGAGYSGSLNMSRQESRDLGAAIGCDFYFIGEAQSLRRSASTRPIYYETYASIFLVSARTGRLILWEKPSTDAQSMEASQEQFTMILSASGSHFVAAIRKAQQEERTERASAVSNTTPIIELLSDDDNDRNKDIQAPRPYRRMKPKYPEIASRSEIEATVDVLVDIDAQGEVGHTEIERWAGYGLDQSVLDTVRLMHFFPAMRDGTPIPLRVLLRFNFRKPPHNSTDR